MNKKGRRCLGLNEILFRFKCKHNEKYDYSLIKQINKVKIDKIPIICKTHGLFYTTAWGHYSMGYGCNKCAQEIRLSNIKLNNQTFQEKANKIHNFKYVYINNYTKNTQKIEIICKEHGSFKQTPHDHLAGNGCQKCSKRYSYKETFWLDKLNIKNRQVKLTIKNNIYFVDGFDEDTNTIYEFYGDYWHGNPKVFNLFNWNKNVKKTFGELYFNTLEKELIIKSAGYKLITMWENDFTY